FSSRSSFPKPFPPPATDVLLLERLPISHYAKIKFTKIITNYALRIPHYIKVTEPQMKRFTQTKLRNGCGGSPLLLKKGFSV
ncbi:MAG: hypothetical protein ACI4KG_05435, partial [Oscillospiraceae bacterium]